MGGEWHYSQTHYFCWRISEPRSEKWIWRFGGHEAAAVVNMDFICTYESGTARVSEESVEVAWVTPEEAKSMVRYPILAKRLANMLAMKRKISFATFEKPDNQIDNFQQLFLNES